MLSVAFAAVRLGVLKILRNFARTPNLHISKRFARATGVGLGEREMHLQRDAPATKSSGYPRPQAEPRRGRKRLRRQVPRRVTRGALRSKVARGCARTAKPRAKAILLHSHTHSPNATVVQRAARALPLKQASRPLSRNIIHKSILISTNLICENWCQFVDKIPPPSLHLHSERRSWRIGVNTPCSLYPFHFTLYSAAKELKD